MVDLFSVAIQSVAGWAIKRTLDGIVSCLHCGGVSERAIHNAASSVLTCPSCGHSLDQFTNATPHTVNANGSIAAARIIGGETKGGLFTSRRFACEIDVVNSEHEDIVARFSLAEFQGGVIFENHKIASPKRDAARLNVPIDMRGTRGWKPTPGVIYVVELAVLNTYGDALAKVRRLMDE